AAGGGQNNWRGRAADQEKKRGKNKGKSCPRLMNDELDTVEEPKRAAARGEVEVALEDLPAEHRHHDQGEGPGGDGEPREERPANLRPWRRKRRPVRDGRLRRRRTRQPPPRDGSRDLDWSAGRRTADTFNHPHTSPPATAHP